jgi:hypothetical protein
MTAEAEVTISGTGTPRLNKALSQLQGELPQIKKTKTAKIKYQNKDTGEWSSHEYSYADLGDVVEDVGPLLAKHGLAFHCGPSVNPADRREMLLHWALLHESGEEKTGEWPLGPVNQKPQALGSAITYGRRYCFTAATNIVLEDDDDGQRAQQDHGSRQSAGDAWEKSTPAPPRRAQGGAPQEDRSWAEDARQRAKAVKTDAEATKLIRETAAALIDGRCTPKQRDHIQNTIGVTLKNLRENATPVEVEDLARQAGQQAGAPPSGEDAKQEDVPGSVSRAQLTKLHAVLTGLGFGGEDREQKLIIAEVITGHDPLTGPEEGRTSKNLSLNEARKLIDTLDGFADRDALIAHMAERKQTGDSDG